MHKDPIFKLIKMVTRGHIHDDDDEPLDHDRHEGNEQRPDRTQGSSSTSPQQGTAASGDTTNPAAVDDNDREFDKFLLAAGMPWPWGAPFIGLHLAGPVSHLLDYDMAEETEAANEEDSRMQPVALAVCRESRICTRQSYRKLTPPGPEAGNNLTPVYFNPDRDVLWMPDFAADVDLYGNALTVVRRFVVFENEWKEAGGPVPYRTNFLSGFRHVQLIQVLMACADGQEKNYAQRAEWLQKVDTASLMGLPRLGWTIEYIGQDGVVYGQLCA